MPSSFPDDDSSESEDSDQDAPSLTTLLSAPKPPTSKKRTLVALHPSSLQMLPDSPPNPSSSTSDLVPGPSEHPAEESNWPTVRTNELRNRAIAALEKWRMDIRVSRYAHTPFSASGILSDKQVEILAYDARIKTVDDLQARLHKHPWVFAPRHGQEVLDILHALDAEHVRERQARKTTQHRRIPDENHPPSPPLHDHGIPSTSRTDASHHPPKPRPVVKRLGDPTPAPSHPHSLAGRFSLAMDPNAPFSGW